MVLAEISLVFLFLVGYSAILSESWIRVNKAAPALLMAIAAWAILFQTAGWLEGKALLSVHLDAVSQVALFLLGAMVLVELIDVHQGFQLISDAVRAISGRKLICAIGVISFLLSAVLDNLTTAIVMVAFLRRLGLEREERWRLGALVVIGANAGGAWSPIGDVTTTMLWVQGKIYAWEIMQALFLPSLACFLAALGWILYTFPTRLKAHKHPEIEGAVDPMSRWILFAGMSALVLVPIIHALFGLPPFMGVFFSLALLWIATDLCHAAHPQKQHLRVHHILTQVDTSGVLFFIGILLGIDALDGAGLLGRLSGWLGQEIGSLSVIALLVGMISAIIDNIPLVAAGIGMYDALPINDPFWHLLAYCAGTGGSLLLLGSAAGIAFMQMEKVSFGWYCRRATPVAFISYLIGAAVYFLQTQIIG